VSHLSHIFDSRFILLKAFAAMSHKRVTESFQVHKKAIQ